MGLRHWRWSLKQSRPWQGIQKRFWYITEYAKTISSWKIENSQGQYYSGQSSMEWFFRTSKTSVRRFFALFSSLSLKWMRCLLCYWKINIIGVSMCSSVQYSARALCWWNSLLFRHLASSNLIFFFGTYFDNIKHQISTYLQSMRCKNSITTLDSTWQIVFFSTITELGSSISV